MQAKKTPIFILAIILSATLNSCSKKSEDKGELLLDAWRIKSQVDILGGSRGYIQYDLSNPKWLEFHSDGRIMCNGIVTPTWIFQPLMNTASYFLKDDIINIGDSAVINGTLYYYNYPMQLKINFISKNLLVIQHIPRITDPTPPTTIDSLVRF